MDRLNPRAYFDPLSIGAPQPAIRPPQTLARMVHFFDPGNDRMVEKLAPMAASIDVVLGNLEDAIAADRKQLARRSLVELANSQRLGEATLWCRINSLDSPWVLDDLVELVTEAGHAIEVLMVPKVEAARDIHYLDRLLAQLEARAGLNRPLALHPIIETPLGMANIESIAASSPRLQGLSFGPADLAAARGMRTLRAGGAHPDYRVCEEHSDDGDRRSVLQDPWHYSIARLVDACSAFGIQPLYGPYGDIADPVGCEAQFRSASVLGCVGAWSLHPSQIEIARRVFTPSATDVAQAERILAAMPDGRGVAVLDGRMCDDASWKQSRVIVDAAAAARQRDAALSGAGR